MWTYNYTIPPDELYHSKYLRKYMGKSGKMVYVYKEKGHAGSKESGFSDNYTDYKDKKGNTLLSTGKGYNSENNFKYVNIGKGANSRDDYKYVSKSFNLGKKKITIDNDEGRLNILVSEKKNKKNVSKGQRLVSRYSKRQKRK